MKEIKVPLGAMVKIFNDKQEVKEYLKIGNYMDFYEEIRKFNRETTKTDYFRTGNIFDKFKNRLEEILDDYKELYD